MIITARDDTERRLAPLAAHRVREVILVDPERRTVAWFALVDDADEALETCRVIDLDSASLAEMIAWPTPGME